jgi:uncharacterized protein (TIGR00269 family)
MTGCDCCGEPAIARVREPNRHFCATHFTEFFEDRVARTIRDENMINPGDRIALALSGGKDSTALVLVLSHLFPAWEDVHLVAITIDEGIAGYRDETVRAADELTAAVGIEHHTVSFQDLFGDNLDTLLVGREREACTVCGILRKKALAVAAERYGATKIATGHNLDDEAQSVLMNTLRGDLSRLVRDAAQENPYFIPRIKPLSLTLEKEIAIYLMVNNAWNVLPECPYTRFALRAEVRRMLSKLEYRHPGTMHHLIETKKKIERYCAGAQVSEPIRRCRECGDPCSAELCQVCRLRHSLGR